MKPRIYFGRGQWWCHRIGMIGCGATPKAAWDDMWAVYRAFVRRHAPMPTGAPRAG